MTHAQSLGSDMRVQVAGHTCHASSGLDCRIQERQHTTSKTRSTACTCQVTCPAYRWVQVVTVQVGSTHACGTRTVNVFIQGDVKLSLQATQCVHLIGRRVAHGV